MAVIQCGGFTRSGRRQCAAAVIKTVGEVPLCERHLTNIVRELTPQDVTARAGEVTSAVVYYVGDPVSQTVKIGTSTRFLSRFKVLRSEYPELKLLAVEPGYFDLERQRHTQFANYRVDHKRNREWYHKSSKLMGHINWLRDLHGDPWSHSSIAIRDYRH